MDPLPDLYAAPEADDWSASELKPLGPLEFAAILFAVDSTSVALLRCLERLVKALGGIGGLGDRDEVWQPLVVNLQMAQDNAFPILLLFSACALGAHERWRAKFSLLALCVVALQVGVGILSLVLGLKREWTNAAYTAGVLATAACFVWAMVNSLRNRSGVAVGVALLLVMPLLHDPTGNRAVALGVVAALPGCLRRLTAPIFALGFFALEHLVTSGATLGVPSSLAAIWLVVEGWKLASSLPVGSGERAALRAGLFLVGVSLLLEQMQFLQQALVAQSRVLGTPFADMAWLATFHGLSMIVVARLLRDVPLINVTAKRMRVVVATWLVAALGFVFWHGPDALATASLLVAALAMGGSFAWAVAARFRMKSFT